MIESVQNERIIKYSKLKNKKYREETGLFIIETPHLVEEAQKEDLIVEIFTLDGSEGTQVSLDVMKKMSSLDNPSNVLAICKKREEKEITGNILILDDLQDPGNLGTIIRTCASFGIDTIVASKSTVDVYNMKTLRASEGYIFKINYLERDLNEFISNLNDYLIISTDVVNGVSPSEIKIDKKFALILGNEGRGVSPELNDLADIKTRIDIKTESLNVGISAGILLYEFTKEAKGN